jgi:hypothetical protein
LTNAQNGTLTPAQIAQQNNLISQGNTVAGQAQSEITGGTAAITQANAGALPAWQQAQIDQQVAAQKAQIAQSLGPNVDSSTLAQYYAQIDQKADITKGQLIQQNLASGEQELGAGVTTEQQGQAQISAGYKVATDAAQTAFQDAISLAAAGNGPIMDAVNLLVTGDTAVSNSLMNFMGALAQAYAGSGKPGTAGTAQGSTGNIASTAAKTAGGAASAGGTSNPTTPADPTTVTDPSDPTTIGSNPLDNTSPIPVDTSNTTVSDPNDSTDLSDLLGGGN